MLNSITLLIKTYILFGSFIIILKIVSLLPSIYDLTPQGNIFPPLTVFISLSLITTLISLGITSFLPGRLQNIRIIGFLSRGICLTPLTLVTIALYIFVCPSLFAGHFFC